MEKTTRYVLETLSPLHIGSGSKLYPIEYIITDKELVRVNLDGLFQEPSFNSEKFISESKANSFYLGNFDRNNALRYPFYRLSIDSQNASVLQNKIGSPNANILEFIREANGFYVPGSSIKGAIRTAMLWFLLQFDKSSKTSYESRIGSNLKSSIQSNYIKKESFSIDAERMLLGEPNYDIMRTLHFGDSDNIFPDSMCVELTYVLSLRNGSYSWKQLGGQGGNTNNLSEATPIFFEALKPGVKINGSFKVDEYLLDENNAINRNIIDLFNQISGSKGRENYLNNIVKACNTFAFNHIQKEIAFYQQINLMKFKEQFEKLLKTPLQKNELFLHLSWGSGYEAKALGNNLDKKLFEEIKKHFRLGRQGVIYPKTRKIIIKNGQPWITPGWVKLRFV